MPAHLRERYLRKLVWSAGGLLGLLALVGLMRLGGGWGSPPSPPAHSASPDQALLADPVPPVERTVRQVSLVGVWARMAAVMIAAYGLLLAVRWWKARSEQGEGLLVLGAPPAERIMQVKESLRMGAGWDLHLLQVGEHLLVVGSNASQMTLLGQAPVEPQPPHLVSSPAEQPDPIWQEPASPSSPPPRPPNKVAGLREREWEMRRAHLIDALRQQVAE